MDSAGNLIFPETAWSGSGGGYSLYFATPSYQAGWQTSAKRAYPDAILLLTAQNYENNLKDDDKALEAYGAVVEGRTRIGGADEYAALQGIARILTQRGLFDDALKTLERADLPRLQGIWKANILKSIEAVNRARQSK